jgi:hypothetical protein
MTCPVTVSSVLRTFGRALTKRPKGVTPVTSIGNGGALQRKFGCRERGGFGRRHAPRCPPGGSPRSLGQTPGHIFSVPTTKNGYESLLAWAEGFGPLRCAGVEGTSSYGAGLARHL